MIDLSHLTEEEQGTIMAVLRRDAELKKAEEERISKLEKIQNSGSKLDSEWKYLTGEWFYEVKSRRHMDKIHGSEIILASMRQKKAGLDGSLRSERSRTPSSQGSDITAPPKPARSLEALQPQRINDAEKENVKSGIHSPRTPRHNPFNRASLLAVEPPEYNNDMSASPHQEPSETENITPLTPRLTGHPAGAASQTSGGSMASEASSAGFRPVPRKRTFLSKHTSSASESSLGLDAPAGSAGVVPTPRRRQQQGSSGNSDQSYQMGQDEMLQKVNLVLNQMPPSSHPPEPLHENSQQPLVYVPQAPSNSSMERDRNPPSHARERPTTSTGSDDFAERETLLCSRGSNGKTPREHAVEDVVILHSSSIHHSERDDSVRTTRMQEELSLPQSTVDPDPPVSYDLTFIDKSDEQTKKSNQRHKFKLSTQSTSPTGDEDSIAKVLDWFSRSTDSNDWLNTEDGTEATGSADKHVEISKLRAEDSLRKEPGDFISDGKKETLETRKGHYQKQTTESNELNGSDATGNKKLTEAQEVMKNARERMPFDDNNDESQSSSHLKSSMETNNTIPKTLIIKSVNDKRQTIPQIPAEKDVENVNKPIEMPDFPVLHGMYNWKGNNGVEREEELSISSQEDTGTIVVLNSNQEVMNRERDSDYLKSPHLPQEADSGGSDTGILNIARLSPEPMTAIQSRLSPEFESFKAIQQPDSINQSPLQDELSKSVPVSQLSLDLQRRGSSEKHHLSRNSPYMDDRQCWNDIEVTPRTQSHTHPNKDVTRMDSEDESMQSHMSPKLKEDISNEDGFSSSHFNRQPYPETPAEKIRQLRYFWEQEKKPMFYTPEAGGEGKITHGANQARLNKRFTKSEYDLTSTSNYSGNNDEDYDENEENFTVIPLYQRLEQSIMGTSRTQFNMLLDFWDGAMSNSKGLISYDKVKSPTRKAPLSVQLPSPEVKYDDREIYHEKTRPALMKSSPPIQSQAKSPHDRQFGSRATNESRNSLSSYMIPEQQMESRRGSKDPNGKEKSIKPQSSGKEARFPKSRKDSFGNSSSRASSMRRATSMFVLSGPDQKDQVNPIHPQSRKQRQNTEKGQKMVRRASEETETPTPLARACVPKDYRHYLGITDEISDHSSFAPVLAAEGSEGKSSFEFDKVGPVRASTPVSSEERYSRRGSKMSQRPLRTKYSSSDTGQESPVSSASETWSNSRSGSNLENDDDEHPVRKALRRAEARPKSLTKSLEDITGSLSPRQERRQDLTADMRRISNISSIPSPSSSLSSDPDNMKKMSKSVPLFLEKEDMDRDTDFNYEDSYRTQSRIMGSSSNLALSSGMASLSGSVMTMYSGDFSNVDVQGHIEFSIDYIQKLKEFHIHVVECRGLAAVDSKRGRSDPYVKTYLVPDKANLGKRKTSVKKKTLNPIFNEDLKYRVRMEYLRTKMLILSVWHHDTFGRNSFLGEVDLDLSKWDFSRTQMNYLALKGKTFQTTPSLPPSNGRGEMRLAIRFLPQIIHSKGSAKEGPNNGEVHIWVKECRNLPLIRAAIDPYVKCFVLPDTSRKSRQKTRVLQRTADPAFNHTMVYDGIREADLAEACVELTVWDRDKLASNLLGGLRLGIGSGTSYGTVVDWMDSTRYEVALWERMRVTPNEWVEDILPLRMLNSAKTAFK